MLSLPAPMLYLRLCDAIRANKITLVMSRLLSCLILHNIDYISCLNKVSFTAGQYIVSKSFLSQMLSCRCIIHQLSRL